MKKLKRKKLKKDNKGFGVIEVVLLIIVAIALVLIFQEEVTSFVDNSVDYLEPAGEQILQDSGLELDVE
ncbi:MAG: Flp1 family type IVb pilin [Clostridiales bacterium]|nr:Flp1 family type IVb pilin [Clostridiales bacterium]